MKRGRGTEREREMAASDLTVIHNSRTGHHEEDEQSFRPDEKVTRKDEKALHLSLKVTAEN